MASVSVRNLVKKFDGSVRAVNGVSFEVADGELVTLLGPSGCGKTTTLRLIAGLEVPDDGEIALADRVVTSSHTGIFVPPEKRGAGMVFQSYAIWPHMTVFSNVAYPLRMQRVDRTRIKDKVEATLQLVGLLELRNRMATHLSGGQQQRTAIARAIVSEPSLLLLDEPLSNLDARLRAQMRAEIRELQQALGITAVYVTHDQAEAMVLSDRVVVMSLGQVQQLGPPEEIYNSPANRFVAEFVGFDNFISGRVVGRADDVLDVALDDQGPIFCCRARGSLNVGDSVVLVCRSRNVDIATQPTGQANSLRGTVSQSLYYGEAIEYRVASGERELVVTVSDRQRAGRSEGRLDPGQEVEVVFASESLVPVMPG